MKPHILSWKVADFAAHTELTGLAVANEWSNANGQHPRRSRALTTLLTLKAPFCLSFCAIFFFYKLLFRVCISWNTGESLLRLASCDSVFSCCCPLSLIVECVLVFLPVLLLCPWCLLEFLSSLCATTPSRGHFWVCRIYHCTKINKKY